MGVVGGCGGVRGGVGGGVKTNTTQYKQGDTSQM